MKFLSIILGVVLLSAITTSVEARSHFSLSFNNAVVAPAPVRYVVEPQPYYEPMYIAAPQPYYPAPVAREVVYMRPAPRPVVVRYERPVPVRQSGFGFSWNFFR